jgi:hypothetical protein
VPPSPTPVRPTATPVPPSPTPKPNKAAAKAIDPRKIAADTDSYVGQNVVMTGRIINVSQHSDPEIVLDVLRPSYTWTDFEADIPGRPDLANESMAAYFFPKTAQILRGDSYRIWGIVRDGVGPTDLCTITLTVG